MAAFIVLCTHLHIKMEHVIYLRGSYGALYIFETLFYKHLAPNGACFCRWSSNNTTPIRYSHSFYFLAVFMSPAFFAYRVYTSIFQ